VRMTEGKEPCFEQGRLAAPGYLSDLTASMEGKWVAGFAGFSRLHHNPAKAVIIINPTSRVM
jgi:hypothetical protein